MMKCSLHIARFLPLLGVLLVLCSPLHAQNEIVASDSAKLLRKVWMVRGGVIGGDQVGKGAGSVGKIDSDSSTDFAWYLGAENRWNIHRGGESISTTPDWTLEGLTSFPGKPVVGDFYGTGQTEVIFTKAEMEVINDVPYNSDRLMVYQPSGGEFPQEPLVTQSLRTISERIYGVPTSADPRDMIASDVNGDGATDLLVVFGSFLSKRVRSAVGEIWIFAGGPNFQLDTPTVVLKDTEENVTDFNVNLGNLDADLIPDLILAANYNAANPVTKLKFWWAGKDLSHWSTNPDRSITLDNLDIYPNMSFAIPFLPLFDTDGDSVSEFLLPGIDGDWYFYNMNATGKDPHTRPFTLADADKSYRQFNKPYKVGYLNDSARRYEMMGRTGGDPWGGARLVVLSGGKNGPNPTYDGYYSSAADGMADGNVFGFGGIVQNCEGTGWDCYLTANPGWHGNDQGIAILLAGGPYIPNDDPSSGVREVSTEEHGAALHVWPNPVRDELHVAWRGDLKHPPSVLQVYDMNGRLIVEGEVESWRGEAIWKCGSVPPGGYVLVVRDSEDRVIASTSIIKSGGGE